MAKKNYWENLSQTISSSEQTKNKRPDTSDIEAVFFKKYMTVETDLLDIGSGTGLIINKLVNDVKHITAVEKFKGFSKFIADAPNVLVINAELEGFEIRKEFDVILCTGVAQYFEKDKMIPIYASMYEMLKEGGVFISRMHCGLKEDIIINGYSEELETDYFAEYRHVEKEKQLLFDTGYDAIEVHDILPDELNVWDNTRHFIFTCHKNKKK